MADRAERLYIQEKQAKGHTFEQAQQMWTGLDTIFKTTLVSICMQEEQNLEDIRLGLLATLSEYQGLSHIKKLFENSLKNIKLE